MSITQNHSWLWPSNIYWLNFDVVIAALWLLQGIKCDIPAHTRLSMEITTVSALKGNIVLAL